MSSPASTTRAGQIEAERQAKAATIPPDTANPSGDKGSPVGGALGAVHLAQVGTHGLALHLGGLAIGSGLALGPEYIFKRGDLYDPGLIWDTWAAASLQGYYKVQSRIETPRLLNDHAFFSVTGLRFDYPRLAYYGSGADSRKTGRTDYRMQDNAGEIRAGVNAWGKRFRAGLIGSYQSIRIENGTAEGIAQTSLTYPAIYADLSRNAGFLGAGFFLEFDNRDVPLDPQSGTYLLARFQNVSGAGNPAQMAQVNFNRYDFEAQQYFHYWNKRRVIATRIKASLTSPHANTQVPFYLQPTLGGSDDLRGFRPYRFYDQNAATATVEYRWRAMEALDMAVFADAGRVYRSFDTFSLAHVQTDVGFGLRARAGEAVPLRIDFGFSREGAQVWLIFYNVF